MTSGGKSLYRQQPKEDDLQRPHSVRNLVIGTGVLGAITIICWYGTGASQSGTSANGFIACSAANCPAPTALPMESPAAAQANANGGSSGNPKAIGGSTKRSGSITGLPPIISALLTPPTTGTTGPVAHPSTSAPGTTSTTPAAGKTSSTPTTSKSATPTPTPDTTPTTVPPTTTPPTTVPPTTVPPTTVPPTTVPASVPPTTIPPTITITASLTVDPTSPGPTTS